MAGKSLDVDKIQLEVTVDGSPARKELAETKQSVSQLKSEYGKLQQQEKDLMVQRDKARANGDKEEYRRLADDLRKVRAEGGALSTSIAEGEKKIHGLRESLGTAGLSANELRGYLGRLKAELNAGVLGGTEAEAAKIQQIEELEQRYKALSTTAGRMRLMWEEQRKSIDLERMSIHQLGLEMDRWEDIRKRSDPKSAAWAEADAGIARVKDRMEQLTNSTRTTADAWVSMRGKLKLEDMSLQQLKLEKQYLDDLRQTLSRTDPALSKVERDLVAVEKALKGSTEQTALQARQWESYRKGIKLTDMSIEELEREVAHLNAVLKHAKPKDSGFDQLRRDAQAAEMQLQRMRTGLGPFGQAWKGIKGQVASAGAVLGTFFAGGALIQGMRGLVLGSAEMSDALADVRRVTGLTAKEVQALSSDLGKIDTRSSRKELLDLASDAGKLGITGRDNLLQFVKAGDQIKVALGEDLGDDAIKSIGKLNQTFKVGESTGKNLEQQMLSTGSAINALGQSSTASEAYLVDFTTRQAGVNQQSGINLQNTLGYAAALDQLGLAAETSSTAIGQFTLGAFKDTATYAELAGMATADFSALLKTDTNEALLRVLEGLNGNNAGMEEMVSKFGLLGQEGSRAVGVLSSLAGNTQLVREQQAIANSEFAKGTSITDEFTVKNTTLAAELDKLGKEFNKVFASRTLTDFLVGAVRGIASFIGFLRDNREALMALAKAIAVAVTSVVAYRVATAAAMAMERGSLALKVTNRAATLLFSAAKALLTGNTIRAAAAMRLFNASMAANPIGLVVAAVTALVGAFISFGDEVTATSEELSKLSEERIGLNKLFESIKNANQGSSERAALIRQLNEQYGEYLPGLLSEKATLHEIEQAQMGANAALAEKIKLQARSEVIGEAQKGAVEAQARVEKAQAELDELRARAAELNKERAGQGDWMYGKRIAKEAEALEELKVQATDLMNYYESVEQRLSAKKSAIALPKLDDGTGWDPQSHTDDMGDAVVGDPKAVQAKAEEVVRSVKWLNDQIKAIRDQQENTSDRTGWLKLEQQAKALEAERDRITGDAARKRSGRTHEDLGSLLEQYRNFQADLTTSQRSAGVRELAELDRKHAEELKRTQDQQQKLIAAKKITPQDAATDMSGLLLRQGQERRALLAKFDAEVAADHKAAADELLKVEEQLHAQQLAEAVEAADRKLSTLREGTKEYLDALYERDRAQASLDAFAATQALHAETEKWNGVIAEAKRKLEEYDAALAERTAVTGEAPTDDELAKRKAMAAQIVALETRMAQLQVSMRKNLAARIDRIEGDEHRKRMDRLAAEANRYRERIGQIGEAADSTANTFSSLQQIIETQADADGVRTEKEKRNIESVAQAQKVASAITIAAKAGEAIATAVASASAGDPYTLAARIAVAVAAVAASIAAAWAAFSKAGNGGGQAGGMTGNPGWDNGTSTLSGEKGIPQLPGSSHAQGGLDVVDAATGRRVANIEGGEAVINKEVASANPQVIDALMAAAHRSDKRVGPEAPVLRALPHYVDGGIFGGSLHADGGNSVVDNRTGKVIAEVEKDEPWMVLSRAFRERNGDMIPTLMEASRKGLRLEHISTTPIPQPNPARVAQAMRIAHMADGGVVHGSSAANFANDRTNNPGSGPSAGALDGPDLFGALRELVDIQQRVFDQNRELLRYMGEVNEGVRNYPTKIRAYTVLNKEYDRTTKEWETKKKRYRA